MPSSAELIIRAKRIYLFTDNELRYLLALRPGDSREQISEKLGMKISGVSGLQANLTRRRQLVEEQVFAIGQWLQDAACPELTEDVTEARCHHHKMAKAKVCRSTKPIAAFPFYPIDTRCEDCIAAAIEEVKQEFASYTARKTDKAKQLENAMLDRRPTASQMASLVAENMGGWKQVAEMYADLAKTGTAVQKTKLLDWMLKFTEEDTTNLNITVDDMSPEQSDKFIVDTLIREYHRRKDSSDVAELLKKQYDVDPPEKLSVRSKEEDETPPWEEAG